MKRKTLAIAGVVAAAVLTAAGIAYAVIPDSNGVYSACMLKSTGTIRLIDPSLSASSLLSHCTSLEQPISWNKEGVSPTVAQLAAGDANCPAGGASITDGAGNTAYVCNGTNGTNGQDGEDFAGTFTSPNGQYRLEVADTGITLRGPAGRIKLTPTETEVRGDLNLSLLAGVNATMQAGALARVNGGGGVQLNGCSRQVAGVGDLVLTGNIGSFNPILPPGFPTVCAG